MDASGQWLRWRALRWMPRCWRTSSSSREILAMRSCTRRRSVSSWVSPSPPRMPMPPCCRDKWPQNRVSRGSKCWSCASSIWSLPSRVRARWAKMSRISDVRSRILQLKIFSRFAALRGRQVVVEDDRVHVVSPAEIRELRRLALADKRGGRRRIQLLETVADDVAAGGRGQFDEFGERIARVRAAARFEFGADEEDPFGPCVSGFNECFQCLASPT